MRQYSDEEKEKMTLFMGLVTDLENELALPTCVYTNCLFNLIANALPHGIDEEMIRDLMRVAYKLFVDVAKERETSVNE